MARDESSGAKIIPKYILQMRGPVPFWVLRHSSLSLTDWMREGNGTPLQCSCPENPRGGGAWGAAVCGVGQSRTRLKRLSSSAYITSSRRLAGVPLSAPFWCLSQKLSLSPLYFNKTSLHKSSEQSNLISGPGLNSSPPEPKNPGVFSFSNNLSPATIFVDTERSLCHFPQHMLNTLRVVKEALGMWQVAS